MRIRAIFPALAMFAIVLRAQAPAAKPGSVEGVVTNSVTGEPVKKAVVSLAGTNTAISDAAGHFHFDNITPGNYVLFADKDGFQGTSGSPSQEVAVADEQRVKNVAIRMVPLATVSGHVFDDDGGPIPRAQVIVLRYFYGLARKQLNPVAFAQSNDLGEFEALNLPPGRYYFQVTASPPRNIPPRTRWTHPEEAYPVTFYPNAREAGQATATDVAAGAHLSNIDFRLRKIPAYHIRGTVTDQSARTGAEDRVMVENSELPAAGTVAGVGVQADGSFDVRGLVNGSYTLSYFRVGPGRGFSTGPTIRVSDTDVNGVALADRPSIDVSGTVTVEGSQPDKLEVRLSLSSARGLGGNGTTGADGGFVIKAVAPQIYPLQIFNLPPGKYVKSIRLGDREINSGEIDLTNGSSAALNIVLSADGGEVDGTVQTASGQPAAAMQVILAPSEEYAAWTG
jgi:hypothetical protein